MSSMEQIEETAEWLATSRDALQGQIDTLQAEIDAAKRRHRDSLMAALREVTTAEDTLREQVRAAPALFEKPRTRTLHGIRLGFMKGRGGLSWDDEDAVMDRVAKLLPEQADLLIRSKRSLVKDALLELDARTLKSLGVHVIEAGDQVFVKAVGGDLDKFIKALQGEIEEVES